MPQTCIKKLQNNRGYTLIEVILIVVVLGIAIPSMMQLISSVLVDSHQSEIVSQATIYAQEKLETILADKANPDRGYAWIITPGNYPDDVPASGFTRSVSVETTGMSQNGIPYALVRVTVSHATIPDLTITTWLTDY